MPRASCSQRRRDQCRQLDHCVWGKYCRRRTACTEAAARPCQQGEVQGCEWRPWRSAKQRPACYPAKRGLTLLTFNVQGYQTMHARNTKAQLLSVLTQSDADVVAVQEDLAPPNRRRPAWPAVYRQMARCVAERLSPSDTLQNTILVHRRLWERAKGMPAVDITRGCPVTRCAAMAEVDGLLASGHTGGDRCHRLPTCTSVGGGSMTKSTDGWPE